MRTGACEFLKTTVPPVRCTHPIKIIILTKQNFRTMKSTKKTQSPQVRFTLALNATWSVLHDPVLTKIYVRKWKRLRDMQVTIYGYVFREMYKAV
jgi:hypothetical protein